MFAQQELQNFISFEMGDNKAPNHDNSNITEDSNGNLQENSASIDNVDDPALNFAQRMVDSVLNNLLTNLNRFENLSNQDGLDNDEIFSILQREAYNMNTDVQSAITVLMARQNQLARQLEVAGNHPTVIHENTLENPIGIGSTTHENASSLRHAIQEGSGNHTPLANEMPPNLDARMDGASNAFMGHGDIIDNAMRMNAQLEDTEIAFTIPVTGIHGDEDWREFLNVRDENEAMAPLQIEGNVPTQATQFDRMCRVSHDPYEWIQFGEMNLNESSRRLYLKCAATSITGCEAVMQIDVCANGNVERKNHVRGHNHSPPNPTSNSLRNNNHASSNA